MGLPKTIGGSTDIKITANTNDKVDGVITTRPSFDKITSGDMYTKKSYFNKEAINADRYNNILKKLKGYADGSEITITYFKKVHSDTNNNSMDMDVSFDLNNVYQNYIQINNFKIKLRNQLEFSYDTENNISNVTGTALVYPKFDASMADLFIYRIDDISDGKIALFKINNAPSRLSIKASSFHEVSFDLVKFITTDELNKLYGAVREVAWFNKTRFLTEEAALIKSNEEFAIHDADKLIKMLTNFYVNTFYETEIFQTYMKLDDSYDPYILDFILKTIDNPYDKDLPLQLLVTYPFQQRTIWDKFSNRDLPWNTIILDYILLKNEYRFYDTDISPLINKEIVTLYITQKLGDKVTVLPYLDFYAGPDSDKAISDFEQLVYLYLNNNQVVLDDLFNISRTYNYLTKEQQFYYIPIFIHILKDVKYSILTGRETVKFAIKSSITDFRDKVYKAIILSENDTIMDVNVTYEVKADKTIDVILPYSIYMENGKYIKIINPTKYPMNIFSNELAPTQKILDFRTTSHISSYSKIRLGILKENAGHAMLRFVDPDTSTWLVEESNGFQILNEYI